MPKMLWDHGLVSTRPDPAQEDTYIFGYASTPEPSVVLLNGHAQHPAEILGNKAFGIDLMRRHNLPVPPAFCVSIEAGIRFHIEPAQTIDSVWSDVVDGIRWLETQTSCTFGHGPRPLLVSVRSGAAQSLPGMMDTVLDVGINDAVEQALARLDSAEFARDVRRRFTHMYRSLMPGESRPKPVPDDPYLQLRSAIAAVLGSWNSPRAAAYRAHRGIPDQGGTALVVQAMVFGNKNSDSGSGVLFSRNPVTGAAEPFGEWLPRSQGDDVVSGRIDVEPIACLRDAQPRVYAELVAAARTVEQLVSDVQEIEFTVEDGRLWLLQTRVAQRSAQAAVRLALQLHDEGLIDSAEALRRVHPNHIETLIQPALQPETRLAAKLLATGLPACPGVVSGRAYTEVDQALAAAERGEQVILVRGHTRPDDVVGMLAAHGIVTEVGGATSHAAVVSRELGRVAVVGCGPGVSAALAGKQITVDGNAGEVREGKLELSAWSESHTTELRELAAIARQVSPLRAHPHGDHPRLDDHRAAAVRTAIATGHTDVVSSAPLLIMLTALRLAGDQV